MAVLTVSKETRVADLTGLREKKDAISRFFRVIRDVKQQESRLPGRDCLWLRTSLDDIRRRLQDGNIIRIGRV